ncbi:MAG: DUF1761 domain-containing protein [Azospirillaceae bacterium]
MIELSTYPWLASGVGFVVAYVIGALWYSPLLFARQWMAAVGLKPGETAMAAQAMAASLVMWLIAAFVYGLLVQWIGIVSPGALLLLSGLVWLGGAMLPQVMSVMFGGRNPSLIVIDGGYILVGFLVFAVAHMLLG